MNDVQYSLKKNPIKAQWEAGYWSFLECYSDLEDEKL